jgi:hypothetical protein
MVDRKQRDRKGPEQDIDPNNILPGTYFLQLSPAS